MLLWDEVPHKLIDPHDIQHSRLHSRIYINTCRNKGRAQITKGDVSFKYSWIFVFEFLPS